MHMCVFASVCITESSSRRYEKYGCQLHNKTVLGSVLKVQSGKKKKVQSGSSLVVQ